LCNDALETFTHHISTVCKLATGVMAQVLHTCKSTDNNLVTICFAGYLYAFAHLG
jgi:hypothetical protein